MQEQLSIRYLVWISGGENSAYDNILVEADVKFWKKGKFLIQLWIVDL